MENNVIVIARRESAQNSMMGALSSFGLFTIFLLIDVIFYIRDRYVWELVILIISAVLAGFSLLGLLFSWSNYSYAKKVIDKPLITFDQNKNVFIVIDAIYHKDVEIDKNDVIEVKISDKGETYLWYNKNNKKTSMFIGYSAKSNEDIINNEISKYKMIINNQLKENNNEE